MYDLVNGKKTDAKASDKAAPKTAAKTEAAPPKKAALQLGEQGVPITVDPKLLENTMGYSDLQQKDYIIDGMNGIDFV